MAHRYINELAPGAQVADAVFLIRSKDLRTTANGSLYIHAVLADKSGQIPARIWQATEEQYRMMPDGGFIRVRGRTESYKGNLQFIIDGMDAVAADGLHLADFMPCTQRDVEQMWTEVKDILRTIQDPDLLHLVAAFVQDEPLVARFKQAPAAVVMHHAYIGGLLEHTLNLLEIARLVIPRYPALSLDLVLTGVFLHDIGKTIELTYGTSFRYSDQGQLLGHLAHGVVLVEDKVREVEQSTGRPFPDQKKWLVQHIVLAHHGRIEYGSPKIPAIPEAIAVHYLDNLDAKIYQYLHAIDTDNDDDADWTDYVRSLETKIYKRNAFTQAG